MKRLTQALAILLKVFECLALGTVALMLYRATQAMQRAEDSFAHLEQVAQSLPTVATGEIDKQMVGIRSDTNNQLNLARLMLNNQLSALNSTLSNQISMGRVGLLDQTSKVSHSVQVVLEDLDKKTLPAVDKTVAGMNTIIENPDIPKLIKDTRFTMAFTGQAAKHIETTSDAVAKAAPATTVAIAGISTDIHIFTSSVTKPQPWWKRILSVVTSGAALYSKF